ncbi:WD repeat protein [Purpureocillium lavendulum]|uniref:WD repeat protein n=1 Tax=Purpureocillium lavendulum TaxID=1247861 RepID=A0AB34FVV3_9HYPO|nr:WD repeat protein [Purpureocillium lavendulum]
MSELHHVSDPSFPACVSVLTGPQPRNQPGLRREFSQLPITALDFYTSRSGNVYLLAGEDTRLAVYAVQPSAKEPSLCWSRDIFFDQPLHGIRVQAQTRQDDETPLVIVWGSSHVAVLDISGLERQAKAVEVVARGTAPDWIYDAAISPWDSTLAVVITAHNEVVPSRIHGSAAISFGVITSPSRPMLYNGRLAWLSPETLLVAAGTVFGDVVVWKYHFASENMSRGRHEMLCTLTGHEGSIYDVDISPEIKSPDGSSLRLLASCSDDRTIRIWDISTSQPSTSTALPPGELTETGFRPTPDYDTQAPGDDAVRPVAMAMGHLSRIWGVKFGLSDACGTSGADIPVYSFGEDSTAQRWQLELDPPATREKKLSGKLAHRHTYSLHNGKHLWAGAVLCREGSTLIATGGGDSKVGLITELSSEKSTVQKSPRGVITVDMQDVLRSTSAPPVADREMISRYDFISEDQVLAITNFGRLFIGTMNDGLSWQKIDANDEVTAELKLTYVFRTVADGAAILGTTTGIIFYVHGSGQITRATRVPGRIVEISVLSEAAPVTATSSPGIEMLVHFHGNSESCYIAIDPKGVAVSCCQTKGLDSRFVATSAARFGQLLVMGSRHGWISLLQKQGDAWCPVYDLASPSRDAITAIVALPPKPGRCPVSRYFLATSRDGKYRIYEVDQEQDLPQLHLLHETAPPFGPMIEGAWFTNDSLDPELVLYGFRSKDFVIWNETRREEVATVECGGAHRTFRLWSSPSDPGRYHFAFTRTSKLSIYSQARTPHRTLKNGTHGREIRALSARGRYLASGAEDTSIRIWEYCEDSRHGQNDMRCLASMKSHVTGIQRLHFLDDEYLFSSAGNEEFFAWRIRVLDSAYRGLAIMCEGVFSDKSPVGDLRIMDFDVCKCDSGSGMLVTLVFSNSAIKTYRYWPGGAFEPYAQGFYTGACLTQARHLGVCGGDTWIMTASTDGHLALWRDTVNEGDTRTYTLVEAAKVHQSSIKSLDMMKRGETYRIVTGGDDNALGFATVAKKSHDEDAFTVATRGVVRRAHAAAINGVAFADGDDDDSAVVVSVSNDQRVRAWRIATDDQRRVQLVGSVFSGVADPGDIAWISRGSDRRVVLGGVGVEVWKLGALN